jgi:hypothetical protein
MNGYLKNSLLIYMEQGEKMNKPATILRGLLGAEVVGIDLNLMAGVYTIVSIRGR